MQGLWLSRKHGNRRGTCWLDYIFKLIIQIISFWCVSLIEKHFAVNDRVAGSIPSRTLFPIILFFLIV